MTINTVYLQNDTKEEFEKWLKHQNKETLYKLYTEDIFYPKSFRDITRNKLKEYFINGYDKYQVAREEYKQYSIKEEEKLKEIN